VSLRKKLTGGSIPKGREVNCRPSSGWGRWQFL